MTQDHRITDGSRNPPSATDGSRNPPSATYGSRNPPSATDGSRNPLSDDRRGLDPLSTHDGSHNPLDASDESDGLEDHDRGLSHDLPTLLSRRGALAVLGGAGLVAALSACGAGDTSSAASSSRSSDIPAGGPPGGQSPDAVDDGTASAANGEIPEETAGPYPGDGSNGVNVLTASGIVRSDITSSFGNASGEAEGVPLTIKLKVVATENDSAALAGAAVYLWHCNRDGEYSLYSDGITQENYLRGVQETDADGVVTFTSIFPAAHSGRWPHIHFEVYESLEAATSASTKLRTSQLALPEEACNRVYATDGYGQSVTNLAQTSLETDMVFSDGYSRQLANVTGDVESGLTATLTVPV